MNTIGFSDHIQNVVQIRVEAMKFFRSEISIISLIGKIHDLTLHAVSLFPCINLIADIKTLSLIVDVLLKLVCILLAGPSLFSSNTHERLLHSYLGRRMLS